MRLQLALGGALMLSLGGLGWMAHDFSRDLGVARAEPSLLEVLEELRSPPMAPEPGRRDAPNPPPHPGWRSPLGRSCAARDPQLAQRLQRLQAQLPRLATRVRIHPTNYGHRFHRDAFGNPVSTRPQLVVLHETVYGLQSALNTFLTPHPRDEDQVSYHTLIGLDGRIVHALEPEQRAFGAGNSAFNGRWVVTNPAISGSVNNFALHLSLETPLDGENEGPSHSGYSPAQYDALALVLADWMGRFQIPPEHITTHRAVDLGGERADPRSFDWRELERRLQALGALC